MSESGTISGGIKWTGLGSSGTDFASVVDKLVAIEQRTITRQQTWQSQWQAKLESINNLDVRLGALKTASQDYDTRDELLARSATSSDEKVATITNTSTAATGVYTVEVGKDVVEKIGSRTYKDGEAIGGGAKRNSNGDYLDADGKVIGTSEFNDANILQYVAGRAGVASVSISGNDYIDDATSTIVASHDGSKITLASGPTDIAQLNGDNRLIRLTPNSDSNTIIAAATPDPADILYPDLTITMGGKTLTLQYDPGAIPGDPDYYSDAFTMEELAETINKTVADKTPGKNDDPPNISAGIVFDKTRSDGDYSRLVITGGEGGSKNHITVSDPTGLCMDRNSIDDPMTGDSWLGCNATPSVDPSSSYTGHVNKTITVVMTQYKDKAILGTNDIKFNWADTEGNSGEFIIRAADWDQVNDCLIEPIELLQGVKINLAGGPGDNYMTKDRAFTIDCQAPVMQAAADIGLAQTDKWVHQGVADLTSSINTGTTGTFAISYAGREYSIDVGEVTLQGLVDKINSDAKNPGVRASILNDGMGTATSYKLVLTGNRAGAENGIRILDTTKFSNMKTGPDTWTHAREASNSMCRIDGYPNDEVSWIQRQTNEVGDVLQGVVLTLQGPGEAQITVQNNVTEMANRIKSIVEAVNFSKTYIKEQTKFTGAKLVSKWNEKTQMFERLTESGKDAEGKTSSDTSGIMMGNYGFQISQSTIDRLMTKEIFTREEYILAIDPPPYKPNHTGPSTYPKTVEDEERDGPSQEGVFQAYLKDHGLTYTRLSDIGIASDPSNQGQYIIKESELTKALSKDPEAVIKLFTFDPGDSIPSKYEKYEDEDLRPRIGGFCVNMGYAMSDLTRSNDVIDEDTGEVKEPAKGITKVLAENYSNIISGIDKKITREEKRIGMVRTRLEEKFARLETLLASLENQSTKIKAQIDKLNGNSSS